MNLVYKMISEKWENRQGPPVLTTVDSRGCPNSIYFTIGGFFNDSTFFIADNLFCKTRQNILQESIASVLFLVSTRCSYQFKGKIEFQTEGPIFDAMKYVNPISLKGRAAAVITIDSIYCGAEKLL